MPSSSRGGAPNEVVPRLELLLLYYRVLGLYRPWGIRTVDFAGLLLFNIGNPPDNWKRCQIVDF
jgi:hypothetical protein